MYAKVSLFLVIKEVYTTPTLTFHLAHDGMAIIKKTNKNSLRKCDEKESHTLWDCK
jgi:hypothetical protein